MRTLANRSHPSGHDGPVQEEPHGNSPNDFAGDRTRGSSASHRARVERAILRLLMVLAIVFAGSIAVLAYGVILDRPALVFSASEWAMLIGLLQLVALAVLALLAGPPRED